MADLLEPVLAHDSFRGLPSLLARDGFFMVVVPPVRLAAFVEDGGTALMRE